MEMQAGRQAGRQVGLPLAVRGNGANFTEQVGRRAQIWGFIIYKDISDNYIAPQAQTTFIDQREREGCGV